MVEESWMFNKHCMESVPMFKVYQGHICRKWQWMSQQIIGPNLYLFSSIICWAALSADSCGVEHCFLSAESGSSASAALVLTTCIWWRWWSGSHSFSPASFAIPLSPLNMPYSCRLSHSFLVLGLFFQPPPLHPPAPILHSSPLVLFFKAEDRSVQHLCSSWNKDFIACGTLPASLYSSNTKENTHSNTAVCVAVRTSSQFLMMLHSQTNRFHASICPFVITFFLLQQIGVMRKPATNELQRPR